MSCDWLCSPRCGASVSRRGSCSLEVMQGLRAKCHARSQSTQQNVMVSESSQPTASLASTPTVDVSHTSSELPPDILQSRMYPLLVLLHFYTSDCLSGSVPISLCLSLWLKEFTNMMAKW